MFVLDSIGIFCIRDAVRHILANFNFGLDMDHELRLRSKHKLSVMSDEVRIKQLVEPEGLLSEFAQCQSACVKFRLVFFFGHRNRSKLLVGLARLYVCCSRPVFHKSRRDGVVFLRSLVTNRVLGCRTIAFHFGSEPACTRSCVPGDPNTVLCGAVRSLELLSS